MKLLYVGLYEVGNLKFEFCDYTPLFCYVMLRSEELLPNLL